jgi:hypothetical protein
MDVETTICVGVLNRKKEVENLLTKMDFRTQLFYIFHISSAAYIFSLFLLNKAERATDDSLWIAQLRGRTTALARDTEVP